MKLQELNTQIRYRVVFIFTAVLVIFLWYHYYLLEQRTKPIVTALMLHSVDAGGPGTEDENGLIITPWNLSQDLEYLKQQGYRFVDTEQMIGLLQNPDTKEPAPYKNVLVTFDDGYRDNYTQAYPVLKQESVKAIINIIVYNVEKNDILIPGRYLLWNQVNEMKRSGIIQFGSHSYNSHHYIQLEKSEGPMLSGRKNKNGVIESEENFKKRIREDLVKSIKFIVKRTGEKPKVITFPYGWAAPEAKEIAKELGFKVQMGIKPGVNRNVSDLQNLKRITVKNSYSPEQLEERIRFYTGSKLLLP